MAARKYSAELIDQVLARRAAGEGIARIAGDLGMSIGAVNYHLLESGVVPDCQREMRVLPVRKAVRRGNHVVRGFTPAEDAKAVKMRLAGSGIAAIAKAIDRPAVSVRARLQILARRDEVAADNA